MPLRIREFLLRRKSADHREGDSAKHREDLTEVGFRVRKMRVRGVGNVIIKKTDKGGAKEVLRILRKAVDEHNKFTQNMNQPYILKKPVGHPIGEALIAMSETNAPSVFEAIGPQPSISRALSSPFVPKTTLRGNNFIAKTARENNMSENEVKERLENAMSELNKTNYALNFFDKNGNREFSGFSRRNILVVGYKEGKFIFVPLMDIE